MWFDSITTQVLMVNQTFRSRRPNNGHRALGQTENDQRGSRGCQQMLERVAGQSVQYCTDLMVINFSQLGGAV